MLIGISIVPDDKLILRGGFRFWIPYESRGFLAGSDDVYRTAPPVPNSTFGRVAAILRLRDMTRLKVSLP